jgi:Lhr-like helicase
MGIQSGKITAAVRSGDTPQNERQAMLRTPPHILVTTPESLYLLMTAERSRAMLSTARVVIVDEIHAVLQSRRGAHLALTLERLDHLCGRKLQRIGLSATQKPIDEVARFLTREPCTIVDRGHKRRMDLAVEVPGSPLEAVMSHEVWQEVYDRLVSLIESHRTTLITVNTRRLAERMAHQLSERLGAEYVAAHHGSLSKEVRLDAEHRLKEGKLKVLVATASLELGIDIGHVDLVCQISSPHRIATFLQRVGRSGHSIGGVPKGRIFPLTRDDLIECAAMVRAVADGELDRVHVPDQPLDVLAQQVVAEVSAAEEWDEKDLLTLFRQAYPYRALEEDKYREVIEMLARGYATRRGRRAALIHYDSLDRKLRPRKGSRMNAIMNGGAIPEVFDFRVILEPEGHFVGTINEDFAIESLPGDVFQLGNTSWRILRIGGGTVRVADARGQPPSMPFWLGEAPARSTEMSAAVSRLRKAVDGQLPDVEAAIRLLERDYLLSRPRRSSSPTTWTRPSACSASCHDGHDRARALLRRVRRHATRAPCALRQPHQPRLGPRAAQEILPGLQLRAAGRGDRGGTDPVAQHGALVPARGGVPLPPSRHRAGDPHAGDPAEPDLRDALALELDSRPRRPAQPRRGARAEPVAAHVQRGRAPGGLSRRGGVPGQPAGRARDSRPSAGEPGAQGFARGSGRRFRSRAAARAPLRGRDPHRGARHARALGVEP